MSCPSGTYFQGFQEAMQTLDLWRAIYCIYGVPAGEAIVGTLFYGAVSLGIFIRTGKLGIPVVLFIILGATILAQMLAVVSSFVAIAVLTVAPVAATAIIWSLDRLG